MARKSGDQRSGRDRRGPQRTGPSVSRRTIKRDDDSSQLSELGESPTAEEVVDLREPDNRGIRGTGGEGGFGTLGGGVYPGEGSIDDAPRGPRAQRRSDESLAQEIREILTNDPELDATEVEVEVEGGAVSIGGVVDGSDAKLLAEELVESVTGVREVHNRLRVER